MKKKKKKKKEEEKEGGGCFLAADLAKITTTKRTQHPKAVAYM